MGPQKMTRSFAMAEGPRDALVYIEQEGLAVASIARDDPSTLPACTASTMPGKLGSEFETKISYNAPMNFRHRQMDRQTDTDIVA